METDKELADWLRVECERLTFAAADLLWMAGRARASPAVIEVVREAPRGAGPNVDPNTLFGRLVLEAAERGASRDMERVINYFMSLPSQSPERRALLEAAVIGTLLGSGMAGTGR